MSADRTVTATFATASVTPPTGDFDRDGRPDVLWQHQGSGLLYAWMLVNGKAIKQSYLTPDRFTNPQWQVRELADFNADGHTDVLWHHQTTGDLYVWFLNSSLVMTSGSYLTPSRVPDTTWQIAPR